MADSWYLRCAEPSWDRSDLGKRVGEGEDLRV